MKPRYELSHILHDYGQEFIEQYSPLRQHQRVLNAIVKCRTAALGGHVDRCNDCQHERISYNSCRNRHCPKCQCVNRERWIDAREKDLLPVNYFHVVFTLPEELNSYCLKYPKELYDILFQCSRETMFKFGKDPKHLGAELGLISILHTWGQSMQLHPHIHMIVPGGGFTDQGKWKKCKSNGEFLFPVKAISAAYRGNFMEKFKRFLERNNLEEDVSMRRKLYKTNWVVYAKEPFLGPKQVIEYLGRYTHKIAISNHRIISISDGKVSFTYKDYKNGNIKKIMTLDASEFLRRFCLHILPPRFVKIRHYGFLSNRGKEKLRAEQLRIIPEPLLINTSPVNYKEIVKTKMHYDLDKCPCCKTGKMIRVLTFDSNAPPAKYLRIRNSNNIN